MPHFSRRGFITGLTGGTLLAGSEFPSVSAGSSTGSGMQNREKLAPRGTRRIVYTSDNSNIAFHQTTDPARPEQLRQFVDNLAANGIDTYAQAVYSQGRTNYYRSERFDYDGRPQHKRFLPMIEEGVIPLEVLIEQSHKRGIEFVAKVRMNDHHGAGRTASRFVRENRQLWLDGYAGRLDFTFPEVRDFVYAFAEEVTSRFDVDGLLLNFIRGIYYFPRQLGRERRPLMTDLIRRVREMLDRESRKKGKPLTLGVLVPETLEECALQGHDVPTWIRDGLIDYVCPCEGTFPSFNAQYEEFAELTRAGNCLLYPTLIPLLCWMDRMTLLGPENYRALAQNFYGAGADGISVFNYQYHWAQMSGRDYPGPVHAFPMALRHLRELGDPEAIKRAVRHYRYHPLWSSGKLFHLTQIPKNDQLVLNRSRPGERATYRFRLCEEFGSGTQAKLCFSGQGLRPDDRIEVDVNGSSIDGLRRVFHEQGRPAKYGRPLPPFSSVFFDLSQAPVNGWDNQLGVRLTSGAEGWEGEIVIDEIEVVVLG